MSNFLIRHYVPETDLPALSRMLTEVESHDHNGERTSEEVLRAFLERPNFEPSRDAWVAEADSGLVGYGLALSQPGQSTVYAAVHPKYRRKGVAKKLLALVTERAKEANAKRLTAYFNGSNKASEVFLKKHGFTVDGSMGAMRAAAGVPLPKIELPTGYEIRKYAEVNDIGLLAKSLTKCYLGMWGHQDADDYSTKDAPVYQYLDWYGEAGVHLLFVPKGDVIGICAAKPSADKDEQGNPFDLFDAPGVIKEYRDQGYQRLLTVTALNWLREHGQNPVRLEFWGEEEHVFEVYRSLGFEMVERKFACYKDLD